MGDVTTHPDLVVTLGTELSFLIKLALSDLSTYTGGLTSVCLSV